MGPQRAGRRRTWQGAKWAEAGQRAMIGVVAKNLGDPAARQGGFALWLGQAPGLAYKAACGAICVGNGRRVGSKRPGTKAGRLGMRLETASCLAAHGRRAAGAERFGAGAVRRLANFLFWIPYSW